MSISNRVGLSTGVTRPSLPYATPFSTEERLAIEDAIREALRRVIAAGTPRENGKVSEVKTTSKLRDALNRLLQEQPRTVEAFSPAVFESPVVGDQLNDFRGVSVAEQPDLVFRRSGLHPGEVDRPYNGLFVEAKVVDSTRGMGRYVPDGLQRFVDGAYAWTVRIGMMVAYVDGPYQLPETLQRYLSDPKAKHALPSRVTRRDAPPAAPIWRTTHDRTWRYTNGDAPGAIAVDHLWVDVA